MDLIAFSVEGYRRFVEKTSVKLHGNLIAIVGPNEAGKTSLLNAMAYLHSDEAFSRSEAPRLSKVEPQLAWQFQLYKDDKKLLAEIHDASGIEKATITKRTNGSRGWSFQPRNPRRNRTLRDSLAERLPTLYGEPLLVEDKEYLDIDFERANEVAILLADGADDEMTSDRLAEVNALSPEEFEALDSLSPEQIEQIHALRTELESIIALNGNQVGGTGDEAPSAQLVAYIAEMTSLIEALNDFVNQQAEESPRVRAQHALEAVLPTVELFAQEDRDLAPAYDLVDHADTPPSALRHLASLASLSLTSLRDEAQAGEHANVASLEGEANRRLVEIFAESWNQAETAVQIRMDGTWLHIQATTAKGGLSTIAERSEGMRWFAALLAFAYNWTKKPILLADEIETHLHYDAQSDLVDVLTKQNFTSKVIYTTHSFGCLPNDLGNGVRAVEPIDGLTSKLRNDFWADGSGFSPLLSVMGAAAVSFTPSRRAIVGEGPCEAILLPTLLRQAANRDKLDFQVVPGLASVAAAAVPDLELEAGRLAFVVDGDPGGLRNFDKLIEGGISESRIVVLRDDKSDEALELEDFVDPAVYVAAVNAELRCWNRVKDDMPVEALALTMVTKSVEAWCTDNGLKAPDKGFVAQRIVDMSHDPEIQQVLNELHRERLSKLLRKFEALLKKPATK